MARPREFDEMQVLDAAIQCFWSRGYEAASVRELAGEMHITGASLYNTFGDKRSLFQRALARYVQQGVAERMARFSDTLPPLDALRAFFSDIIERSVTDPQRKGCLLANSALEVAPHDSGLRLTIVATLEDIEGFFHRCLKAGQRNGTINAALPPEDLARQLLTLLMGLRVLARSRPERVLLEGAVKSTFFMLAPHATQSEAVKE